MKFLNVAFGIYAFTPKGWLLMLFIIVLESIINTKFLLNKWHDRNIFKVTIIANSLTGFVGIVSSLLIGKARMIVWFPWVDIKAIDFKNSSDILRSVLIYVIAFVLTVLGEYLVFNSYLNGFHRNRYPAKTLLKSVTIANVVSYLAAFILLYIYSLGR